MPQWTWPDKAHEAVSSFETRHAHPDAGALLMWAMSCVRSLHYLDDLDRAYDVSNAVAGGHVPDVVDVAHARWATGTCVTALDLCGAGLGRALCGHNSGQELDLGDFKRKEECPKNVRLRAALPPAGLQWCESVFSDADYQLVRNARNWLTHSRLTRHFTLKANGPPQRLTLELKSKRIGVRELVERARDVSTKHVALLVALLPKL